MSDTFPVFSGHQGRYSHQPGEVHGNKTGSQDPRTTKASSRPALEARVYASRGGAGLQGQSPIRQPLGAPPRRWREVGAARQAPRKAARTRAARARAERVRRLKQGARAQGFATELWTLARVGEGIARRFHVRLSHTQVWRGCSRALASACSGLPRRPSSATRRRFARGRRSAGPF